MSGAGTMLWKEWREQYWRGRPTGMFWAGVGTGLFFEALGALLGTFSLGEAAADFGVTAAAWGLVASLGTFAAMAGALAPLSTVVDAVAGERERHTLETLLAGPLRDREILWGKAGAQVLYAAAVAGIAASAGGIVAFAFFGGQALLPVAVLMPAAVLAGALAAAFFVALAILVSLRAPTVKSGQQRLGFAFMPFMFIPLLFVFVGGAALGGLPPPLLLGLAVGVPFLFLVVVALVVTLLIVRFRRRVLMAP